MSRGFQPVYSPAPRRGAPRWLLALVGLAILVVVVAAAIMVLSGNQPPTPSPSPTSAAAPGSPAITPSPSAVPGSTAGPTSSPEPTGSATAGPTGPTASETPGPTVDPALAEQIDAVIAQLPAIRQLEPTSEVPYEFISREQFQAELIELNEDEVPPEVRAAEERLYKRLGLLPDDADLDELLLDLYGAQVAAFYRPDNGRFYIIQRDAPFGPIDKIITAHEYIHALQDMHFDLEETRIVEPSAGDQALAQLAVIEGDATMTSQLWAIESLSQQELIQVLTESLSGIDQDALAGMPLVLRRQLEFPYTEGFLFVDDTYKLGGFEAVDQAIANPPASTEQILHSDKYFNQEAPQQIDLQDASASIGDGWSLVYEQRMGELMIQILATGGEEPVLNIPGLPVEWPHAAAAAGWGGDRLHMYENGDQWAIVWHTEWDTDTDAEEFENRLTELLSTFDGPAQFTGGPSGGDARRLVIASDAALLGPLLRPV